MMNKRMVLQWVIARVWPEPQLKFKKVISIWEVWNMCNVSYLLIFHICVERLLIFHLNPNRALYCTMESMTYMKQQCAANLVIKEQLLFISAIDLWWQHHYVQALAIVITSSLLHGALAWLSTLELFSEWLTLMMQYSRICNTGIPLIVLLEICRDI